VAGAYRIAVAASGGADLSRDGVPANGGMVALTSRVDVEMVQATALICGCRPRMRQRSAERALLRFLASALLEQPSPTAAPPVATATGGN
jgi:hypothetical protein